MQYSRPLTVNFSPFFPGSEGLVTSADLAPSFSEVGLAAPNFPMPKKRERIRQKRMDILNFDFIVPPKY
jgi:hypothetical protein